tara:strand:+ start:128835 stop:129956 length:1122 start_codon:yes stop_codon:yes gene_type:complete
MKLKSMRQRSKQSGQQGLSLIELLVSMAIALVIFAGVIEVMLDNKSKFLLSDQLSIIQENARFTVEEIGYDLRMAGYKGCSGSANVANALNGSTGSGLYNGFGVEGWDSSEGSAAFPAEFRGGLWTFNDANKTDPDAFTIKRAGGESNLSVTDHTAPSAVIDVAGSHGLGAGRIMVTATPDCSQVAIFQFTGNNPIQVGHNTGNSVSPGNCSGQLFGSYDCTAPPTNPPASNGKLPNGSQVMEFVANSFYIGQSSIDPTIPSLYKEEFNDAAGGTFTTSAVELVVGVENMQVLYGVDTDADGQANRYVTANAITGVAPLLWSGVVSARVSLLFRSLNNVWGSDTTFSFEGEDYTDRFARQRVTTTIQLRNMGL